MKNKNLDQKNSDRVFVKGFLHFVFTALQERLPLSPICGGLEKVSYFPPIT